MSPAPVRRPPAGTPARPPFAFTMRAPAGWTALRGDAVSLGDDLLALVARTPLWQALDDRRRGGLGFLLHGVARASAASGAVATLLRLPDGPSKQGDEAEVSSISLTWLRTAPVRADLDLARLVLREGEPVTTGLGPGLGVTRHETTTGGGEQHTVQVAAPVPDSIWLAVLTGTTTTEQHVPALEEAVLAVAASLGVDRPPPAPSSEPPVPALVATARRIATAAHRGQVDKAGAPYIGHPPRVAGHAAAAGGDHRVVAAAWLHDVVEDTVVTPDDLRAAGIPDDVVAAVLAVSKRPGESLEDYVARVRADPLAVAVKTADLADNTDPARLARLDEATRLRLTEKYARVRELLAADA